MSTRCFNPDNLISFLNATGFIFTNLQGCTHVHVHMAANKPYTTITHSASFYTDLPRLHPILHQGKVLDCLILLKVLHGTQAFHHQVLVTSWVLQVHRFLVLHTICLVYLMDYLMDETCLTPLEIFQRTMSYKMSGQTKLAHLFLIILTDGLVFCSHT
jgi:hypothetical protein